MTDPVVKRSIFFVLLGVAAFALKARYSGPFTEAIHNWGGNVLVSFAVYFLIASSILGRRLGRLAAAIVALLIVELFEATNGFGVMTNVYDSVDFAANVAGVGVAVATDIAAGNLFGRRAKRTAFETRGTPITEPGAPPNGGPGNSGVTEGPPSVDAGDVLRWGNPPVTSWGRASAALSRKMGHPGLFVGQMSIAASLRAGPQWASRSVSARRCCCCSAQQPF